jgi:hypothetical protein
VRPVVPGADGIGVVVGAPGVVVVAGGIELPEPTPVVELPPTPGDAPSVLVPLGEMPGVLVAALGDGANVLPVGPGVVRTVPPVVFGNWPVVVLGLAGATVEPLPPRLLPPPPAPRLELPLPIPALPPMVEPVAPPLEVPAAPPPVPPALPLAANAAGAARINTAAVAVNNRFVMSAVMQFTFVSSRPAPCGRSSWLTRRLRRRSGTPPALDAAPPAAGQWCRPMAKETRV